MSKPIVRILGALIIYAVFVELFLHDKDNHGLAEALAGPLILFAGMAALRYVGLCVVFGRLDWWRDRE